jgi:cysteine desulfuration protein SufE
MNEANRSANVTLRPLKPRQSQDKAKGFTIARFKRAARLASRRLIRSLGRVTLAEKQQRFIDDYLIIDDAQERLAAIVDNARRVPPLPDTERTEANRVKGCVSQAWITTEISQGLCQFRSDADSPLVRGLLKLLCDLYSGATPVEVAGTEPVFLEELDLARNLSPTRLNGLRSVRAKIRDFAAARVASGAE